MSYNFIHSYDFFHYTLSLSSRTLTYQNQKHQRGISSLTLSSSIQREEAFVVIPLRNDYYYDRKYATKISGLSSNTTTIHHDTTYKHLLTYLVVKKVKLLSPRARLRLLPLQLIYCRSCYYQIYYYPYYYYFPIFCLCLLR